MTRCKESSCRLCRKYIADKDFQVIDSVTRDILDVLLLKLEFCTERQDVICNSCNKKLRSALDFKSTCLNTNNAIIPHVDCEEMIPVDLNEVYIKVNGSGHVTSISYDDKICRLCMKVIKGEIRCIEEEELEVIQKFVPGLNIMVIKDPVVCTPCFDSLCTHNTFLKNCLDAEQRTRDIGTSVTDIEIDTSLSHSFIKNEAREESIINEEIEIKTESIDIKSEEVEGSYTPFWNLKDEPVESTSECQSDSVIETFNDSMLKDNEKRQRTKNENCTLKYRETLKKQTYKNDSCGNEADQKRNLTQYQRSPKKILKKHKCNLCDFKTIYKGSLIQHQLRHKDISKEQMYKCDLCDYKTNDKTYLIKHQLRHKDIPEDQMYKCDSCHYKSKYKQTFARHQLRHKHIPEDQMYHCYSCNYKTGNRKLFIRHQLRHKDISKQWIKCDVCNYKTIYKDNFKKHQLRHKDIPEEQMYKCDSCDYKTIYKNNFKRHQVRHKNNPGEQLYKCDSCDYKTIYKNKFKRHQVRHKNISDGQMHKCDSCDFGTIYKGNLIIHQLKHKNIPEHQMYKCYSCNFKTLYKQSLIIHQLVHRGMSQHMYKCDFCDYKTGFKNTFKRHQVRHKNIPEQQMHKCDSCDYKTIYNSNFKRHQVRHKKHL